MPRRGIQLCYPFEERRLAKWRAPYLLQPKLDGDRCRALIDADGNATLLTSEENVVVSVPHINEALKNLHLRNVELDGELYTHGAPHEWIHGQVSREVNIDLSETRLIEYHVFDIITADPQVKRTKDLIDLFSPVLSRPRFGPIQLVPTSVVGDLDEIMAAQERFAKDGYEGFVVREMSAPYVRRRSTSLMKFKPRKEDIYEIVGFQEEFNKDGIPKNTLGALLCQGTDGTLFSVGSGNLLTLSNRKKLWEEKETLVGKSARVKYQHLTHAKGVPRFPVIVEII